MRTETVVYTALSLALVWYLARRLTPAAAAVRLPIPPGAPGSPRALPMPTVSGPKVQDSTLAFLRSREGLRLSPYPDAGGYSIGYGHFLGSRPEPANITTQQAEKWLQQDANAAAIAVAKYVSVPLSQNQFDALVSFVFNLGAQNFAGSTLLDKLNTGDYDGAAEEFDRWVYSGGQVLGGLKTRRAFEKSLFTYGV
jgi:lysozyme